MAEASASSEDIAHDDLCPVSCGGFLGVFLSSYSLLDLPAVAFHASKDTLQSSAVCILHGTVGRYLHHEPNRGVELGC